MDLKNTDLSISLAIRQKRLHYWKINLLQDNSTGSRHRIIPEELKNQIKERLATYGQLLAKFPVIRDEEEFNECEKRLSSMEREFNSYLENRKLLTSNYGVPFIKSE